MLKKTVQSFKLNNFNALNQPEGEGWKIFDGAEETSLSKVAALNKDEALDIGGFDIKAEIEKHPDWLYFKALAIIKDEPNDNGDAFSEEELIKAAHTFIGVPVFTNHQNDDIEKARGKVVHAWYDYDKGGIWIISGVDKIAYPPLARGIEQGYVNGTSMGVQVAHSCCSVCHNCASTADQYCLEENTPILMSDFTVKKIKDIIVGDSVIDAYGKITKVTDLFVHDHNEKICKIKSRAICKDLLITKNHPILIPLRNEYRYCPTEYISDNQTMLTPVCKIEETNDLFSKFNLQYSREQQIQLVRLLGYYGAEGCIIKREGKLQGVEFSLHLEEEEYANEIKEISKSLFNKKAYDYNLANKNKSRRIRIWNKECAELINNICPGTTKNRQKKYIKEIFSLDKELKLNLLSTYIDGDGYSTEEGSIIICTAVHNLASQLFYLSLQCNLAPSINVYKNQGGPFNRLKDLECYRIVLGHSQIKKIEDIRGLKIAQAIEKKKDNKSKLDNIFTVDNLFCKHSAYQVEEIPFSGKIYNFETESHSYVANNTSVHNCTHVKNQKTRRFSGKIKCQYHKSKFKPQETCPVCNCKEGEETTNEVKEAVVHEKNYGLKFIEDSLVVNPACHECLIERVINPAEFLKQANYAINKGKEIFAEINNSNQGLLKVAGKTEIQYLNDAMKRMEVVAKSMMDQKEQVSMEYVSDIIEVLASLQTSVDELVEMGYGQLPSPSSLQNPENVGNAVNPDKNNLGVQSTPQSMQPALTPVEPQKTMANLPSNNSSGSNSLEGGIGTVTKPSFSASADKKIKDFVKLGNNIIKNTVMAEFKHKFTKENVTAVLHSDEIGNDYVSIFEGENNLLRTAQVNLYPKLEKLYQDTPDLAALTVIEDTIKLLNSNKESQMSDKIKTAAGKGQTEETIQSTTEKQLDSKIELHPRTGESPDVTTNKQLEKGEEKKVVDSESGQKNKDNSPEVTTNKQFDLNKSSIENWDTSPDVITEAQWTDFNRAVGAELKDNAYESITESQLKDLVSHHRWTDPEVITEKQLSSEENWLNSDAKRLGKKAASAYAKQLVASAIDALSDAIAYYKVTPNEIVKAAKFVTNTPQNQIKAAFLTLVNGLPTKVNARKAQKARNDYFQKVAGTLSSINPIDALLASMGDNCKNLKTEDLVDAIKHITSNPAKMAKVEEIAKNKLTVAQFEEEPEFDKASAFDDAFNDLESQGFKLVNKSKSITSNPDPSNPDQNKTVVTETTTYEKCEGSEGKTDIHEDKVENSNEETNEFSSNENNETENDEVSHIETEETETEKEDDGLTQVRSTVEEIEASPENETEFVEAAERFGRTKIANNENQTLYSVEYDPESGVVFTTFKETGKLTKAEKRNSLIKEAQAMGGQMGPSGAGAPPAPGAGATLPTPPAGPEVPPVGGLGGAEQPPLDETSLDEEEGTGEVPPPGTICPQCGSKDVDVISGKHRCNACGNKFITKVVTESLPNDEDKDNGENTEDTEDKGLALGEDDNAMPNIPVAASALIRPDQLKKFANNQLGSISPITGSSNTLEISKNNWLCMDSGLTYNVDLKTLPNNPEKLEVTWSWTPKFASYDCPTCNRTRKLWTKALESFKLSEEDFEKSSFSDKINTVLAMQDKGLFKVVKTASTNSSVVEEISKNYKFAGKFPEESCREKIARRFGENAIALSGPNKGEKLVDCVCKQLKNANVYSDKLALKIADTWSDRDACVECMEDVIKAEDEKGNLIGYTLEQAASACQLLKAKYASNEELFAEELTDSAPVIDTDTTDTLDLNTDDSLTDEDADFAELESLDEPLDVDPSSEISVENPSETAEKTTIELPLEVVNQIEEAIDKAHGENPAAEPHHDIAGLENQEVEVEIPTDAIEGLEDATEDALETETGTTHEENEISLENEENKEGIDSEVDVDTEDKEISMNDDNEIMDEVEFESESDSDKFDSDLSDEDKVEASKLASYMRKGYQGKVGEINLDLSKVMDLLNKKAESEGKEIKLQRAQESVGKIQDGKTLGNEEKFDADKPEVPVAGEKAQIGQEKDLHPGDTLPKVPSGDANLGHEKEQGYTSDGATFTGGRGGAGKAEIKETSASSTKQTKVAEDKKVGPANPVAKEVPFKIQENKDLSKSGNPRTPDEGSKTEPKVEEGGEKAFMGHEKETLNSVPKATDTPSIPTGGGRNDKYDKNENYAPEGQTKIKGTRIASDESKSEAIRLAGKMLENKIITANDLVGKINELQQYGLNQLKDIETAMFKNASKGLQTMPDGLEKAVFAQESEQPSLVDTLTEMFTLGKQVKSASKTNADLRKTYNK